MRALLFICLTLPTLLIAQQEFPTVWQGKFSVDAEYKRVSDDLAHIVGGDFTEIEMLDGTTGKSLWVHNFKEKNGVKKCERWSMEDGTGTMRVVIDKGKEGGEEELHLDFQTGAVVASAQLAARTKEKEKVKKTKDRSRRMDHTSAYDAEANVTIDLAYDEKNIMGVKKGSDLLLTVEASGAKQWKTEFTGRVVSRLTKLYLPSSAGDVILDVVIAKGRVYVVYEGITCLDLNTGNILWNTSFDNVEVSTGLKIKQEIGRSAMPLVTDDGVYICDFSKGERTIKKLEPSTGAVIWQADKLKNDDIVSELVLDGGNLIARFGGVIRVEQYIPGLDGNPDVYKVEYAFEGSTSLRAYNAASGKPAWHTGDMDLADNFKKAECNILSNAGKVYACGEKNMYVFDAATGKLDLQGDYNAKEIGKAKALYVDAGAYMIEGEKGIARLGADLKPVYATNTGKCLLTEMEGDAFIVWTGKDMDDRKEFIRFDPLTGAIMGKLDDCYRPHFSPSGDRFVRFDGQKAIMYRTN